MEWQPIETAPKDGSVVLGWCVYQYGSDGKAMFISWWDDARWVDDYITEVNPIHWIPLPEPPK